MKNKFLVSLLFGTALCAGFGDVAFGMETDAQTEASNLVKKYKVGKFINDTDFSQQANQDIALALINNERVSSSDKAKLQAKIQANQESALALINNERVSSGYKAKLQAKLPLGSSPAPALRHADLSAAASGGLSETAPLRAPAASTYKSYKAIRNTSGWTAETANRKFVTAFIKAASEEDLRDVLNHIPDNKKIALAEWAGQAAIQPSPGMLANLSVEDTPPSRSRRELFSERQGYSAPSEPVRMLPSVASARLSEKDAAVAYVQANFTVAAARKVAETFDGSDQEAINDILRKYGYTSKESFDSRGEDSLSSYTATPSSLLPPAANTSTTATSIYAEALDHIGRNYSAAAVNKAKAVFASGNRDEIEELLTKYKVPR